MTQTVVGIFNTVGEAESAVAGLMNGGFDRESIDILPIDNDVARDASDTDDSSLGGLLGALFSSDDNTQPAATDSQQRSTVTVHAQSEDMADRAADILDACGAVDIDETKIDDTDYTTQGFPGTVPPVTADPAGGVSGYTSATIHDSTTEQGIIKGRDQY